MILTGIIAKAILSAMIAYTAHYASSKAYDFVCVPDGIMGYLYGFVSMGSPICKAGMTIMTNTQVSYSSLVTTGVSRLFVDMASSALGIETPGTLTTTLTDVPVK
uniref:Uncharacterized protein n=1 Tax=viral metagenome TaxID=1070528 RepID=A0A6C0K4T0_9ZZZZ